MKKKKKKKKTPLITPNILSLLRINRLPEGVGGV